ncbi:MAG: adenylyl-sulfate kinase [Chthoniobacterales bacterium]
MAENIHTEFHRFLTTADKERLLGQRGGVFWMVGLSGSGKSTVANAVERSLHEAGRFTMILDGDNLRSGLNTNLGFTGEDRQENIRRTAEVAKLFASAGVVTFVSLITPREAFRRAAREIVGENFHEIYVRASFEACARRDPKGLYQKAAGGGVANFTGKDSSFEEPTAADLTLDTEADSVEDCATKLLEFVRPRIGG